MNVDKSALLGGNEKGRAWSHSLWTLLHCLSHLAEDLRAIPSGEVLVFLLLLRAGLYCHCLFQNQVYQSHLRTRDKLSVWRPTFWSHSKDQRAPCWDQQGKAPLSAPCLVCCLTWGKSLSLSPWEMRIIILTPTVTCFEICPVKETDIRVPQAFRRG